MNYWIGLRTRLVGEGQFDICAINSLTCPNGVSSGEPGFGHIGGTQLVSITRVLFRMIIRIIIKRGYVKAAEIIDTDPRKIEKSYALFRPKGSYSAWFHAARDRQVWDILFNFWVAHWIGFSTLSVDCKHFMGKQLVAVDTLWASLRPSRTPPFDEPYNT